jgi:hypothetical protein
MTKAHVGNPCTKVRFRWTDMRDPAPIRAHVTALLGIGMTDNMIARAAGLSARTVTDLHRRERRMISAQTADAIMAVTPRPSHHQALVLAYGVRRRLEALAFEGHTLAAVGAALGVSLNRVAVMRAATWVTWETHVAVAERFDRLAGTLQGGGDPRTMAHARRKGYLPALAWLDLDDYYEVPDKSVLWQPITPGARRQQRRAEVSRLTEAGLTAAEIAVRVGASQRQVVRDRAFIADREAS